MNILMSNAMMMNNYNRSLQRKANKGFTKVGLPLAKQSGEVLEPVSPLVAQRFQAQMEREVQRREMAIGLILIGIAGGSAAMILLLMGMF
ncbi:MAG: hypothetical protein AAFY48_05880 [Bacteroidota bacterium]